MTTAKETMTAYRNRNLTLDQMQKEIESYLGMSLLRGRHEHGLCELTALSQTGVAMFKIHLFRSEGQDGWQYGGHGELLGDSFEDLSRMHQTAVEIEL